MKTNKCQPKNSILADKKLVIKLAERYGHKFNKKKWSKAAGGSLILYCDDCWQYVKVSSHYKYKRACWFGANYIIKSGYLNMSIGGTAINNSFRLKQKNKHNYCIGAKLNAKYRRKWTINKNHILKLIKENRIDDLIKYTCGEYPK